ncbi:MAG: LysE family translocator [Pyrinomonadaceae bacterium]|nr:LysE family translocator [Pyrinomonadaceae bacterium]
MVDWSVMILFITAALVLVFIPGPNSLYIVARSMNQGRGAGIISSLGVQVGTLFHVAAAAFGVSALLLSSALAFNAVKYAGAAYLIYLGIKTLLSNENLVQTEAVKEDSLSRVFYQGFVVQLLNPKTALFFFSFLPQFVNVERGAVPMQILFFGAVLVVLGFFSDTIYAVLAGSIGGLLRENLKFLRLQRYFAGSVYIGLGAATALTGTSKK